MDMNAEMAKYASDAADMVLAEYHRELDFSEATIGAVEAILNGFWQEGGNDKEFCRTVALLFEAYIGEMIRRYYPEATRVSGRLTPDSPSPKLHFWEIEIAPVDWCFNRLYSGPADSVVKNYLSFRQAADERSNESNLT